MHQPQLSRGLVSALLRCVFSHTLGISARREKPALWKTVQTFAIDISLSLTTAQEFESRAGHVSMLLVTRG